MAMEALKTMEAMKATKKVVHKIAEDKMAKHVKISETQAKSNTGLNKSDLIKNTGGKIATRMPPSLAPELRMGRCQGRGTMGFVSPLLLREWGLCRILPPCLAPELRTGRCQGRETT